MQYENKSKIVGDTACPTCRSHGRDRTGNHLILFADGGAYCNRCGYTESPHSKSRDEGDEEFKTSALVPNSAPTKRSPTDMYPTVNSTNETIQSISQLPIRALPERRISEGTASYFGVRSVVSETTGETTHHYYPVYTKGTLSAYKVRSVADKTFFTVGSAKGAQLFGTHTCTSGGKTLYITEGELDALSLYQALTQHSNLPDWSPCVVSVPNGAASAAKSLTDNYEFVDSFDKIVFVFDNDPAGEDGLKKACALFPAKSYVARLSLKDPNEMLLDGQSEPLKWAAIKARLYQPDNIINAADAWEKYKSGSEIQCVPYPDSWVELNNKTYGVREGSVITVASGSGCGKTQFLREIKYHLYNTTGYKMADISLEESIQDTMAGLMSLYLKKRIQLPDVEVTEDEEKQAFDYLYSSGRWSLYDHFGGMDDDNLFTKLRYFAATGHKVVFLDHLSIIVSEYASEGGERERIDTIMTRLAKLAKEFGLIIFLVVHLKKQTIAGQAFEQGLKPTLDDLRGSGSIKQLSWDVLFLTRNQQHPDTYCANTSLITVGKCRFTGRTGDSDFLNFNDQTGRMDKVEKPFGWDLEEVKRKQSRGSF